MTDFRRMSLDQMHAAIEKVDAMSDEARAAARRTERT